MLEEFIAIPVGTNHVRTVRGRRAEKIVVIVTAANSTGHFSSVALNWLLRSCIFARMEFFLRLFF